MKVAVGEHRAGSVGSAGQERQGAHEVPIAREGHAAGQSEWLTSEEAGLRLGLGRNTLAEWRCERRANQPPHARFGGRALRYNVAALDSWAHAQVVNPAGSSST